MSNRLSCFIVMPYSEGPDRVYVEGVVPVLRDLPEPVLALRADTMGSKAITLKAHVENAVRSADFCVVDLTGANPNVMYELGYAIAIGKPTLLIRRRDDSPLPANLMSEPVVEYDEGNLLDFRGRFKVVLEKTVERSIRRRRPQHKSSFYLTDFDEDLMERLLASIGKQLFLLVSSTEYLAKTLIPGLQSLVSSGLQLRIIAADPEGEFAKLRSQNSGMSVALYRTRMWEDLNLLRLKLKSLRGVRGELRILDEIIPNSLFITDNVVFVAPYMTAGRSREEVAFLISKSESNDIYKIFLQEFDKAWLSAKPAREAVNEGVSIPPETPPSAQITPPSRGGDADEDF